MKPLRLGIIADTHGLFDRKIPALFNGVTHIIHAGDVESPHILDELRAIGPLTAVAGNVDMGDLARLPQFARLEFGDKKILVTHIIGRPTKLNAETTAEVLREKPDVLIYGHTHLPKSDIIEGILIFNPGAAGPKRFDQPRTVAILEISGEKITTDWISLE